MNAIGVKRAIAGTVLGVLSLALAGCLIIPGTFAAQLELIDEDRFTFSYHGEIHFLGLSNLAQMEAAADEFEAERCYDDSGFEERTCTETERAQQRVQWEAGAKARAAEAKREAQAMAAMMGGVDPTDPEAVEDLRELLLRQRGWQRVEHKGDGVFDVRYSISGTLGHDFLFPMIEGFPVTNSFVQVHLRKDGLVRIDAPGFSPQNESNPMAEMMGGMVGLAGLAAMEAGDGDGADMPELPVMEGTFAIVTDGAIRANNTDKGAEPVAKGQKLVWDITPRTKTAPTALIDMTP